MGRTVCSTGSFVEHQMRDRSPGHIHRHLKRDSLRIILQEPSLFVAVNGYLNLEGDIFTILSSPKMSATLLVDKLSHGKMKHFVFGCAAT